VPRRYNPDTVPRRERAVRAGPARTGAGVSSARRPPAILAWATRSRPRPLVSRRRGAGGARCGAAGLTDEELIISSERAVCSLSHQARPRRGGKGMRVSRLWPRMPAALEVARRDGGRAFGAGRCSWSGPADARHIEIQGSRDAHARDPLGERDCSLHRWRRPEDHREAAVSPLIAAQRPRWAPPPFPVAVSRVRRVWDG